MKRNKKVDSLRDVSLEEENSLLRDEIDTLKAEVFRLKKENAQLKQNQTVLIDEDDQRCIEEKWPKMLEKMMELDKYDPSIVLKEVITQVTDVNVLNKLNKKSGAEFSHYDFFQASAEFSKHKDELLQAGEQHWKNNPSNCWKMYFNREFKIYFKKIKERGASYPIHLMNEKILEKGEPYRHSENLMNKYLTKVESILRRKTEEVTREKKHCKQTYQETFSKYFRERGWKSSHHMPEHAKKFLNGCLVKLKKIALLEILLMQVVLLQQKNSEEYAAKDNNCLSIFRNDPRNCDDFKEEDDSLGYRQ